MLSTGKKFFAATLIISLIGYALYAVNRPNISTGTEEPPGLNVIFDKSNLSGSLDSSCKLPGHRFNDEYVARYQDPAGVGQKYTIERGIGLYHTGKSMSFRDIINSIIPDKNNRIILAHYAGNGNFAVYPPIEMENVIKIDKPASYKVPSNNGFYIISCHNTQGWDIKPSTIEGKALPANIASVKNDWILMAASEGMDLRNYNITNAWIQKKEITSNNPFNLIDPTGNYELDRFKMVWIYISDQQQGGLDWAKNSDLIKSIYENRRNIDEPNDDVNQEPAHDNQPNEGIPSQPNQNPSPGNNAAPRGPIDHNFPRTFDGTGINNTQINLENKDIIDRNDPRFEAIINDFERPAITGDSVVDPPNPVPTRAPIINPKNPGVIDDGLNKDAMNQLPEDYILDSKFTGDDLIINPTNNFEMDNKYQFQTQYDSPEYDFENF